MLFGLLGDRDSWVHQVAVRFRRLIKRRVALPAFHPNAEQRVLFPGDAIFALMRHTRDRRHRVLAVTNVTAQRQHPRFSDVELADPRRPWRDAISGEVLYRSAGGLEVPLRPYGVLWLMPV